MKTKNAYHCDNMIQTPTIVATNVKKDMQDVGLSPKIQNRNCYVLLSNIWNI